MKIDLLAVWVALLNGNRTRTLLRRLFRRNRRTRRVDNKGLSVKKSLMSLSSISSRLLKSMKRSSMTWMMKKLIRFKREMK